MKKFLCLGLVCVMILCIPVHAAEIEGIDFDNIPVIDDTVDYSALREPVYSYEDGFIIKSYVASEEELLLGEKLQQPHTHTSTSARHFSLTSHVHEIRDVVEEDPTYWVWRPTTVWTANSQYPDIDTWPEVSWETSVTGSAAVALNLSVGVTDSVATAELGTEFTASHEISTATTRTFKVPYQKDGRIKVNFWRPYITFTCVTTWIYDTIPITMIEETGEGDALGAPYDMVVDLETRDR